MEDEFEGLSLDLLAHRAMQAWHGDEEHPYERLSDLIVVILEEMEEHEIPARSGDEGAARSAKVLRAALMELRIANDTARSEKDRRFFLIQGIRTIRRYMELD